MKTDSFFPLPSSCVTFDDTIHSNVLSVGYFKGILIKNLICKFTRNKKNDLFSAKSTIYESNKIDTLLCV